MFNMLGIQQLASRIKNSEFLGRIYIFVLSNYFKILDSLIKTDKKQILFVSFSGRQYSDSPRAVYERMVKDPRFDNYRFIWGVRDAELVPSNDRTTGVNINSFSYYRTLAKSGIWIGNTSVERLIHVSGRKHLYLQTWHGIPLKHLGPDEPGLNFLTRYWYKHAQFDLLTASGEYDQQIFQHIFPGSRGTQITGLPRNENLGNQMSDRVKQSIKKVLNLDENKRTILFAPTFREYQQDSSSGETTLTLDFNDNDIMRLLDKYNVLFRGHYFVGKTKNNPFVDVSKYQNLNELMQISDLLVTDYSSIMFDFSLLHKPVFLLLEDLQEYSDKRGLYIDPRQLGLSFATTTTGMVDALVKFSFSVESKKAEEFVRRFNPISDFGLATRLLEEKVLQF